jgi:cytochrome P450
MLFRHTTGPTELAGTRIPEGALVLSLLGSANRDPRKFVDPETFDLNRNAKEIASFGYGPHFCLGQYLSRMEAKIAIQLLLQRFSELMPVNDEVIWTDTYFARGPKMLPVRFKVR